MCEFIATDIDMTKLSKEEKEKLKKSLEARKQQLETQAKTLGEIAKGLK